MGRWLNGLAEPAGGQRDEAGRSGKGCDPSVGLQRVLLIKQGIIMMTFCGAIE